MRISRALVVLLIVLAGMVACTVMNELHLPTAPPRDAGADSAVDSPCVPAQPPPAPPDSPGEDPANDIVVAFRSIGAGTAEGAPPVGYDLDGVCSCAPDPESCRGVKDRTHCDLDAGRDNATTELFRRVALLTAFDIVSYFNARIVDGAVGLLVRVERYNGRADDSEVTVSIYGSLGPERDDKPVRPDFAARDRWSVTKPQLVGDPGEQRSRFMTTKGYVAGNVLVAKLDIPFSLASASTTVFRGGVLSGRITKGSDGKPTIADGILAGRWAADELLVALGRLPSPTPGQPLCAIPNFVSYSKGEVCGEADVALDPSADRAAACDALSVGFTYLAVPAILGAPLDEGVIPAGCGDAAPPSCDPP